MKRILVVGDVMLDHYISGVVERQSPEADVPVLLKERDWYTPGGAANTAINIVAMGIEVDLVAPGGGLIARKLLLDHLLHEAGVNTKLSDTGSIPVKTRFVTEGHHHLLRMDEEKLLKAELFHLCVQEEYDVIVVADYAKGAVSPKLMDCLKQLGPPIIVDPKPENSIMYYGIDMACPNLHEWELMLVQGNSICTHMGDVIVTRGSGGIEVITEDVRVRLASNPIDVVDVCGAGDTVTAVMAVCKAMGKDVVQSAKVALKCAEWVITQPGTVPVTKEVFERNLV